MLEKIGLPPKPSLRGNSWVVDASHCQGCPSQFTFINRKHHCRRCGGLFCWKCTQKRMILRGQGDSPVRICEPCKKIEETSRFVMWHGHKGRAGRGVSTKVVLQDMDMDLSQRTLTSSTSLSNTEGDDDKSSTDNHSDLRVVSGPISLKEKLSTEVTPEELRCLASMEKGKYKVLKGEGKSGEAIIAFKRAKEAERQANALELLRKRNNKKVAKDICHPTNSGKVKADFADELMQLGWSEAADVLPGDRKGELSSLLREICGEEEGSCSVNMSQVMALKKKALLLKREGKRDEAKEELKKAKILERQLEEQRLMAEPQHSDEEIAALIHTMDSGQDNVQPLSKIESPLELDVDILYEVDVTEDDLNDPEMSDVLRSLGWEEEAEEAVVMDDEKTPQKELLRLKKAALLLRREGKGEGAVEELRKCDVVEKKVEEKEVSTDVTEEEEDLSDPSYLEASSTLGWGDGAEEEDCGTTKVSGRDRLRMQQECLRHKRQALKLRREGRVQEAESELSLAVALEARLEGLGGVGHELSKGDVAAPDGVDELLDPHLLASLKEVGLGESGDGECEKREKLEETIKTEKMKAVRLKREGRREEALDVLRNAKFLEKKLKDICV